MSVALHWNFTVSDQYKDEYSAALEQYPGTTIICTALEDYIGGPKIATLLKGSNTKHRTFDGQTFYGCTQIQTYVESKHIVPDATLLHFVVTFIDIIIAHTTNRDRRLSYMNGQVFVYQQYIKCMSQEELSDFCTYLCDRLVFYKQTVAAHMLDMENSVNVVRRECDELRTQYRTATNDLRSAAEQTRIIEEEQKNYVEQLRVANERYAALMQTAKTMAKYVRYKQRNLADEKKLAAASQLSDEEFTDDDEPPKQKLERMRRDAIDAKRAMTEIQMSKTANKPTALAKRPTAYILSELTDELDGDQQQLYVYIYTDRLPDVPHEAQDYVVHDQYKTLDFYSWSLIVNQTGIKTPAYYAHIYEPDVTRLAALEMATKCSRPLRPDQFDRLMSSVLLSGHR